MVNRIDKSYKAALSTLLSKVTTLAEVKNSATLVNSPETMGALHISTLFVLLLHCNLLLIK
jgi:hypothetical protein